jgi:16S rRNA G966 N2-methylase RsmD
VVQKYIDTFTRPGDLVLDPFGGSGVTYLEALILGRKAIHIDINPLSKLVVETVATGVDVGALVDSFNKVVTEFLKRRPKNDLEIDSLLQRLSYPKDIVLPANSDVRTIEQLFDRRQLAELALLKNIIIKVKGDPCKKHLLLMFSSLLNKINLTYHASKGRTEGRGDSAIFRYYRYRIAHTSPRLDIVRVFRSRLKKVLAAKEELRPYLSKLDTSDCKVLQGSATSMTAINDRSVDYIYADPPYGAKIPYLDLSIMWNA